jgi:hypothetical protein
VGVKNVCQFIYGHTIHYLGGCILEHLIQKYIYMLLEGEWKDLKHRILYQDQALNSIVDRGIGDS